MGTSTTTARRALAAVAAAVLALGLSACSAEDEDQGVASAGGASTQQSGGEDAGSQEEQQLAFTRCLRENGADIKDGDGEQMGIITEEDPALDAALKACADLAPSGEDAGALTADQLEMLRAFAGCMRGQGIDMPDPDPETGMASPQGDVDQEAMQAGFAACQEHLDFGAGS